MNCSACHHDNPVGSAFCEECGARLERRCPSCGSACTPTAKFCRGCGASLAGGPAEPATDAVVRKVVTIVFADLIGSTSLHERLDPESVSRVMDRYHRAVRAPVEAHGGTVVQLLGDGVMCAFGVPRVAEDDAIRAVRAAVGIQEAFRAFAREEHAVLGSVGLRVAVNTGEVVVSDEYAAGIGDPLNVAARLQQEAQDGDVLIGESTQRLVSERVTLAPIGTFALRGRAETVTAYRVVSLERPAGAAATAFVGRDEEMQRLAAVYDAAVAAPGPRLAVILGSPGLGKSRLLAELARRLGDRATVLAAQCDAAGSATFAPLAAALRACLRLEDGAGRDAARAAVATVVPGDESARIADGIGALLAGTPASPEETFFVVRRLLAALAAKQPVVLAIDDLQWAEPLLLDLTEHIVQWSAGVPLLVLVAARPELRDLRSSLATSGALVADVVTLGGLDAAAATRLAANVVGTDALPAAIAGRVLATSEGNPLFVGELVRMLVHDGALKREGDRWTIGVELARLEMPPTIQALLAARIERLRPEERTVLERAAVIGRQFSRTAVAQLLPREITDLDARLESLRRSELIEPDAGWLLGEPVLRFHHVLIRDAAYRRVLKGTRADLHARFADCLESRAGDAVEHEETIGWHLEQAHQNLRELGPLDERGRRLGERAARYLASAGRRALARDDVPLASGLLGRSIERLDPADPDRAELALDWCEALLAAGDVGAATGAVAELARFSAGSDRLRAWHTCFAGQLAVLTDPNSLRATADAVAAAANELAAAEDAAGEAKAHAVHATALARLGQIGPCEAALDRALAAARRARDRRRANAVLAGAPLAALWGPGPVTRASGRCLDVVRVLRITQGSPAVEAVALRCQAVLEALRGRADAAGRMLASSRQMVEELGITQRLLEADVAAGQIALLEADAAAAERSLRAAYDGFRAHGLAIDAAQAAALLGRALLALGREAEAEALSHESEALAGDDLRAAVAWRGVRAEALARRGEHAVAVDLARAAVEIASATDALLDHAEARSALAAALRAAGRHADAEIENVRVIELWEAKGATLLVERARRGDAHAERQKPAPESRTPAGPVRRRVQPNAVAVNVSRFDAAIAAADIEALGTLLTDDYELIDHLNGVNVGRVGILHYLRETLRAKGLTFGHELVATLGESLALCRGSMAFDELSEDDGASFGETTDEFYVLVEGDADRHRRVEQFAHSHLGDAVGRLYERYAELLPDGPARERAAATARSIALLCGPPEPETFARVNAPDTEFVDHRPVGFGAVRGARTLERAYRAQFEIGNEIAVRIDDVLAVRSDGIVIRRTFSGTARVGGGAYESPLIALWMFGADGLNVRTEWFAPDRADDALALFDELVAEVPAARAPDVDRPRRVRPNAATAMVARVEALLAARDIDGLSRLLADDVEIVHRPTGTTYDGPGVLDSWHRLLEAKGPRLRYEVLATLGDALALCRRSTSFDELADFGPMRMDAIALIEVGADGRLRHGEAFAEERLGDGILRLYGRFAELLPDGPARTRAAATARSVAALCTLPPDLERFASAWAPDVEYADHQTPSLFGSGRGVEGLRRALGSLFELAEYTDQFYDVVHLTSDALLVSDTLRGIDRVGGGAFEQQLLVLWVFGADGLATHNELYDPDREDEALARLDALVATPSSTPRFANAATRACERFWHSIREHDWEGLVATCAPTHRMDDRRRLVRVQASGEDWVAHLRIMFKTRWTRGENELLATRGDRLALFRWNLEGIGPDGGEFAIDGLDLSEVDADGRRTASLAFDLDGRDAAWAELDDRFAAGEGAPYAALLASLRAFGTPQDREFARLLPDDFTLMIHRRFAGTGTPLGRDEVIAMVRTGRKDLELRYRNRTDHIPRIGATAGVAVGAMHGTMAGGDFEIPWVNVFTHDGSRPRAFETYDLDQLDAALARYEELAAGTPMQAATPARPVRRRVQPNAATASADRLDAAVAARDADALAAELADGIETIDHATGAVYDRQGLLFSFRSAFKGRGLTYGGEPLATLGDSLLLRRHSASGSAFAGENMDVGPYEREKLVLIEVDAMGRRRRTESFAPTRLADAVTRLYERYAELLPDGPEHTRAAATARAIATLLAFDVHGVDRLFAPDMEFVDHRRLGLESARGVEAAVRRNRALLELADHLAFQVHDVLGARPDVVLWRSTLSGTDRASGGAFEQPRLELRVFGAGGRQTRLEFFDVDRVDEALARFDELTAEAAPPRFANAAARAYLRFVRAIREHDWDGLRAMLAPTHALDDRRRLVRLKVCGEEYFAHLRLLCSSTWTGWDCELLATRGERLALFRERIEGTARGGVDFEAEQLALEEVGPDGRVVEGVSFDLDDLDAAYDELDDRYAAGEGAPYAELLANFRDYGKAVAARDREAVARLLPDDYTIASHRRFASWEPLDRAAYFASWESLRDLRVRSTNIRHDHALRISPAAGVWVATSYGTLDGGDFELPMVCVYAHDGHRTHAMELFDLDQLDAALARYEELTAGATAAPRITNAATRSIDRFKAAWEARDWDRVAAEFAPGFQELNRRKMIRVDVDRDPFLEALRGTFEETSSGFASEVIATRGERLALGRLLWSGTGEVFGPSEIEFLQVVQVDADGHQDLIAMFDLDDLDAAYAELDRRFAAGEAPSSVRTLQIVGQLQRAVKKHDSDRLRSVLAPDFVFEDHRPLGAGRLSRDEYVAFFLALVELRPDAVGRVDHILATSRLGVLFVVHWEGTREAGAFEIPSVGVIATAADGRIRRWDAYPLAQLDAARARFDAIDANVARDPLAALWRPNAATAASDRAEAAYAARDWAAMRAAAAPDVKIEDRRRHVLVSEDVDEWIADRQRSSRAGSRFQRRLVGSAGDRLALERVLVTGGPPEGPFEIEYLWLIEADEDGRLAAGIGFDVDDWRAANREAAARWFARDAAAAAGVRPMFDVIETFNDRKRIPRELVADDIAVDDHRRTGFGQLEGVDAYLESIGALGKFAPDVLIDGLPFALAYARYGSVHVLRRFGTYVEGAAFEACDVHLSIVEHGRLTRVEVFELEDADAALARFAELRPDPLRIPPNAACRVRDRTVEAGQARDWQALRAMVRADFSFEDRSRRSQVSGDVEVWIRNLQFVWSAPNVRHARELIGTAGDRIALERTLMTGGRDGSPFEVEKIMMAEIDEDERLVAVIMWDAEDRRAAFSEAEFRFAAGEAAGGGQAPIAGLRRAGGGAFPEDDWSGFRQCLADDLVLHDHRRLGLGVLPRDEWIESLRAQRDLAPDVHGETFRILAWNRHGRVCMDRMRGTMPNGGGPFENVFIRVIVTDGDRIQRYEIFDVADVDRALARFEELCTARA